MAGEDEIVGRIELLKQAITQKLIGPGLGPLPFPRPSAFVPGVIPVGQPSQVPRGITPTRRRRKISPPRSRPFNLEAARTIFGETGGLYPQLKESPTGKPFIDALNAENHDPATADLLERARADIAQVFRNGGIVHQDQPKSTNPFEQRAWDDSIEASQQRSDLPKEVRRFFIWPTKTGRERPPDIPAYIEPYRTYGPFINVGGGDVKKGTQTYIDFYWWR